MAQSPPTRFDEAIEAKQRELRQKEAEYQRAKLYVKSAEFTEFRLAAFDKIRKLMKSNFLQEAEANFVIGRLVQIIEDADEIPKLIEYYEKLDNSLIEDLRRKG